MKTNITFLILFLFLFSYSGCVEKHYPEFKNQMESSSARGLYEPIFTGQKELLDTLDIANAETFIFSASTKKSAELNTSISDNLMWDENKIIFYKVQGKDGSPQWLYFNPRELRLMPINSKSASNGDMFMPTKDKVSILRAIPFKTRSYTKGRELEIFRFDFILGNNGKIYADKSTRLTFISGNDILPVYHEKTNRIFFLHEETNGHNTLLSMNMTGKDKKTLFSNQNYDIRYLNLSPDGTLVFAANIDGYYKLYEFIADTKIISPYNKKPTQQGETPEVMLGSVFKNGRFVPALYKLPSKYNLKSVLALTKAYNPEINKKRALLAASWIEAGQAKLANIPYFNFGAFYTPRTGVFMKKPVLFSGDFLAEGISRGIFGIFQPLLDIKRNAALSKAAIWRAAIAADALQDEINTRLADAAVLYFETLYAKKMTSLYEKLVSVCEKRLERQENLREKAQALRIEILEAEKILQSHKADREMFKSRLEFLKSRIREVCGISERAEINLSDEEFYFENGQLMPLAQMRQISLLNHPRIKASKSILSEAFYLQQAGPEIRPVAGFTADYGHSRREFSDPVDDYITFSINGRIPFAAGRARQLNKDYWRKILDSMRIEQETQARKLSALLEEAFFDHSSAHKDYVTKLTDMRYYLEELRVARLHKEIPRPNATPDFFADNNAELKYLASIGKIYKTKMDLGITFARLWRQMGLASRLAEETEKYGAEACKKNSISIWLWKSKEIVENERASKNFIRFAKKNNIRRAYLYVPANGELFRDRVITEKVKVFLFDCEQAGIDVWALLGEPEWLGQKDTSQLDAILKKIMLFNESAGKYEPRFKGIKLDIEPHSDKNWADTQKRTELINKYISLLESAKKASSGKLDLWLDCPVKFFSTEHENLLQKISTIADGITLMCYFNHAEKVAENAAAALSKTSLPLEIGLELSEKAPETDTLAKLPPEQFLELTSKLVGELSKNKFFRGISIHDYSASVKYFERSEK